MCTAITESQESDLYDECVLNEIKNHVDIDNLPTFEEEILPDSKFEIESNSSLEMNSNQSFSINTMNYPPVSAYIPITEEFSGIYNFEVSYCQGKSKNCVYSERHNKIYIDMEQPLPLRFKWQPSSTNLWLRATLVYAEDQYRGNPVKRCHNHMATSSVSNQNIPQEILRYVVRCSDASSVYEDISGHMSVAVLVGVLSPGCPYIQLDYKFYCKNSCSSGMNRRVTQLVFTLETTDRQIVGRRSLYVRVCSCPKRDKEKEEVEMQMPTTSGKKRKNATFSMSPVLKRSSAMCPPGKKVMLQSNNSPPFNLSIKLPDKKVAKEALYDIYKILSAKVLLGEYDYNTILPFIIEIKQKLESL